MRINIYAAAMVTLLLLSGLATIPIGHNAENDLNSPGVWAQTRYFIGYIGNLTPENHDDVNLTTVLQITGVDTNTTPPTILGPWPVYFNLTTMEFSAEVDLDFHDYARPWEMHLLDRYGWNETGGGSGGIVPYPMPEHFVKLIPEPELIPNGTLYYIPGVFGNLSLKIINLTSGEPLPGVRFNFLSHDPFVSANSGLQTDENGDVLFENMQVGLEGADNQIRIYFEKPHFNTEDGTGYVKRTLKVDQTVHYEIGLKEDPLVRSSFPADGATGIRTNGNQAGIFVQFHTTMNTSSVNADTVFIEKVGGARVELDYSWSSGNQLVNLIPISDLEYNTSYRLTVLPRVLDTNDNVSLWRTFTTTFTTWEMPPVVSGTVLIDGTTEPAPEGTTIRIDNTPMDLVNGHFSVEVREEYDHTITVWGPTVGNVDEYLYYGERTEPYVFNLQRGEEHIVEGLVVYKHETRSVILTAQNEEGTPMGGVNITQFITGEFLETDEYGNAQFDDIRLDLSTPFKAAFPNYYDSSFSIYPGTEDPTRKNVTMLEKPLPVEIIAISADIYIPLENEVIIGVDDYFRLDFENDMNIETMSPDNIKILGPDSVQVPIDIFNMTENLKKWRLTPRTDLSYNSRYTFFISEQVADKAGNNPLWRDLSIVFNTESLPSAAVNGRVTINDKGVEGVRIEVYFEETLLDSGYTEANGAYLLDIDMNLPELFPVTVVANGTDIGLSTKSLGQRTLKAGFAIEDTDFELLRLPDWITVIYPKDPTGRMIVSGSITVRFKEELQHSDPVSFLDNFTLGSPPVTLTVEVSEDGRSVILRPEAPLAHDMNYVLSISNFADGEFHREMTTVSGSKALIRGEVIEIMTEFKPIEVLLTNPTKEEIDSDNVSVDTLIYIYFTNYTVNRTRVESNIEFVRADTNAPVGNLTFNWATTGRGVGIDHDDLEPMTEYMLALPDGEYGTNGARMRSPFLVYFTTETKTIIIYPIDDFPGKQQDPGLITVSAANPLGRPIRISVSIRPASDPAAQYKEISNFTLAALEERQVQLDFTDKEKGEYQVLIRLFDGVTGVQFYEYTRTIFIGEEDNGKDGLNWVIIIVVVAVVIIIMILGIFLYMQSRKSDIEEELKEEFECPVCHNLVSSDDSVCPHCGAEFEEEAYKCPKCGNMLDPDDDACPECGYDFSDQDKMELEEEDGDISDQYEEEDDMELDEDEEFEEMEEEEEDEEKE